MSSEPHLSMLAASLPDVRTYGVRLASHSACGAAGRSASYEDFLSFVRGDAAITLNATSITLGASGEAHPFPAATERRLLALLQTRANKKG
jgi:hypothetical protein